MCVCDLITHSSLPGCIQNGETLLTVDELGLGDVLRDTEEEESSLPSTFTERPPMLVVVHGICFRIQFNRWLIQRNL